MSKRKTWEEISAVAVLCIRHRPGHEREILLGPKTNGSVKGFMMPLGGHTDEFDYGPISAGHREVFEEGNLRLSTSQKVAELRIKVHGKRRKSIIHVTMSTSWTGRLRNKSSEFEWLRFIPLSKIPWELIPTKEEGWMKLVLFKGKKCIVRINCGENRRDVLSITTKTVTSFH
jgi:8-oxo-dGTP pyrophosphatase MutT (NUDIX family)